MAGLGLLVAAIGAVGFVLNVAGTSVMDKVPVPPATWPIMAVAGFVLYTFTRRSAD